MWLVVSFSALDTALIFDAPNVVSVLLGECRRENLEFRSVCMYDHPYSLARRGDLRFP
jgi:hypothetical protein